MGMLVFTQIGQKSVVVKSSVKYELAMAPDGGGKKIINVTT